MTRDTNILTLTQKWPGIRRNPSLGFDLKHVRRDDVQLHASTHNYYYYTQKTPNPSGYLRPLVRLRKGLGVYTGK